MAESFEQTNKIMCAYQLDWVLFDLVVASVSHNQNAEVLLCRIKCAFSDCVMGNNAQIVLIVKQFILETYLYCQGKNLWGQGEIPFLI